MILVLKKYLTSYVQIYKSNTAVFVINLTVQAFLYGEYAEAFISKIESDNVRTNEVEELKIWRKKGPIGKLHNIVTFIHQTPQRREVFQKIIVHNTELVQHYNQLQVVTNNKTR